RTWSKFWYLAFRWTGTETVVAGADSFSTSPPEGEVPEFRPGARKGTFSLLPELSVWYHYFELEHDQGEQIGT
ncbi:hypothetical protein, partial [Pseudomonas aeruginosa]|uniref:hypothetical protein n=1 Tax=Pseudomonas aeruginosa TaxID=287 RepID=UPI001CD91B73